NAKIYFNFSPCNELAIRTSLNKRNEFSEKLDLAISCDLLTNIEDCIMDSNYFYDTNFHLNSAGAIYYTSLIIQNLKRVLRITMGSSNEDPNHSSGSNIGNITIPEPPKKDDNKVEEPTHSGLEDLSLYDGSANNDFIEFFNYRLVGASYVIENVKDEFKDLEEVILPSSYNGKNITGVRSNAFYGCINLKRIYIGKTYKSFEEKSFAGCIALEKIYLYEPDGNTINVPKTGLMDGAGKNAKIYIPEASKANYTNGYTWEAYAKYFVTF
ncbi:MAG: leucine-rich repeat protein, partial [Anaeroplasmataceae bacterium]|nr:leucine-rich repeat protein [Anaeroplasmataceae bacterium]